ncbi:MAG: hypothetical protein AB4352_02425 [Hormoscilla sp.]
MGETRLMMQGAIGPVCEETRNRVSVKIYATSGSYGKRNPVSSTNRDRPRMRGDKKPGFCDNLCY